MEQKYKFKDNSGERKYFSMIPHYIVNHSTAYEQSLYLIMKRIAGEDGSCYASLNTLSKMMGVHKTTTSKTIKKLLERNWIKEIEPIMVKGGHVRQFSIVDLWKKAINFYDNNKGGAEMTTNKGGAVVDGSGAVVDGSGAESDTKNINKKIDKEDNSKELVIPPPYGNPDINILIETLKKELGGSPDGTVKENRQFANLLLKKFKKDYPDKNPVELIQFVIQAGLKDSFHCKNLTSFKYLYYHSQKIIQSVKGRITNPKYIKIK
jgi:hypothetical protein